jgi:hypothetical protein
MVTYLNSAYGECVLTTKADIQGQTGMILQSVCGWTDATGHLDVWDGSDAMNDYHDECSKLYFWKN